MSDADPVLEQARQSGLLQPGRRVLALLSGGADSVCLVHVAIRLLGAEGVGALHVNHGLRADADADQQFCVELCERLGVPLHAERVSIPARGNTEGQARAARYRAAEAVRSANGYDLVAAGHTRSDQVETILYRLVASPGRRALAGMQPRRDRLVRPLLGVTREQTRSYCERQGLAWREDDSNQDRRLARNRLRLDVLPALREIHPAAEQNILATAAELRDEAAVLEGAVDAALADSGAGPAGVEAARLARLAPPLRRLVLRRLAEQAAGGPLPIGADRVEELERLATGGGTREIDLGEGVTAVAEYGVIRFRRRQEELPLSPVELPVPGRAIFGAWEVSSELEQAGSSIGSLDEPVFDRDLLAGPLTVRSWQEGDRLSPLGLGGSKSLQDVFTDRKIPRALRRTLPVVEQNGEIAWVAGVAISDRFKVTDATKSTVRLRATALGPET